MKRSFRTGTGAAAVLLTAILLAAAGIGPGCADGGEREADIEALRALPYAGSVDAGDGAGGVLLHDPERTCPGYRLYTSQKLSRADLIDEDGRTLRSWTHPPSDRWERAELLENGDLLAIGAEPSQWADGEAGHRIADDARYLLRLDWDGRLLWKRKLTAHHDVEVRPDGMLAALTFKRRQVPTIHPEIDTRDDRITILDPEDGTELHAQGMLFPALRSRAVFPLLYPEPNDLGGTPWVDLFHSNSLEWMREEALFGTHPFYAAHHVLLCFRHQNRVAILDTTDKRFVWAWGDEETLGPHDAQLLPDGNVLLFDNGLGRGWSRGLEVDPRTDEIVWEWRDDPPESFYTPTKGSVQRLPNGNTLMAESDSSRAIEVAPDGEIVCDDCANPVDRPEGGGDDSFSTSVPVAPISWYLVTLAHRG